MGRFTQAEMFGLDMGHGDPLLDAKKKECSGTDEENPMPGQDEPVVNKDEKGKGKKKESYLPRSQRRFTNREHPALEHDDPLVAGGMHKKEGSEDNTDDDLPPGDQDPDDQGGVKKNDNPDEEPSQTEGLINEDLQAIVNSIDDFFEKNIDKISDELADEADQTINDFIDFLYDIDELVSGDQSDNPDDSEDDEPLDKGDDEGDSGDGSDDDANR